MYVRIFMRSFISITRAVEKTEIDENKQMTGFTVRCYFYYHLKKTFVKVKGIMQGRYTEMQEENDNCPFAPGVS